jgi:hypothetical protein
VKVHIIGVSVGAAVRCHVAVHRAGMYVYLCSEAVSRSYTPGFNVTCIYVLRQYLSISLSDEYFECVCRENHNFTCCVVWLENLVGCLAEETEILL